GCLGRHHRQLLRVEHGTAHTMGMNESRAKEIDGVNLPPQKRKKAPEGAFSQRAQITPQRLPCA
ncbi:hypothetical protein, partial [Stenotrophomonas sp. AS012628]|uniref:hypothetical protein n=1 Tax=Stenotrophomonas sp. AS012628 TaxID=2597656 RepID=UPI001CAA11E6